MPATQDGTDQVKFLVSCIGHSTNGRPDFAAVAEELGIVTKAAAQKRYERMLKANGVNASKVDKRSDAGVPTPNTTPVKRKAAAPRAPASAKKLRGKKARKEEADDDGSKDGMKKEEGSESELSGTWGGDETCIPVVRLVVDTPSRSAPFRVMVKVVEKWNRF
ncbi:hypothetical protein E4U41_000502 [Claviceps citrina]|nr:hypothetical protein E4U41_000502 [Claviceps citrina]